VRKRFLKIIVSCASIPTVILFRHKSSFEPLDQYITIVHFQQIDSNLGARIMRRLARRRIPLPSMPRTDKFVPFDHSLSQRPAAMQADIIHRRDRSIHIGDADDFIAARKFPGFTFGRKFGLRGELNKHLALGN